MFKSHTGIFVRELSPRRLMSSLSHNIAVNWIESSILTRINIENFILKLVHKSIFVTICVSTMSQNDIYHGFVSNLFQDRIAYLFQKITKQVFTPFFNKMKNVNIDLYITHTTSFTKCYIFLISALLSSKIWKRPSSRSDMWFAMLMFGSESKTLSFKIQIQVNTNF
jgi:hypothetical protein